MATPLPSSNPFDVAGAMIAGGLFGAFVLAPLASVIPYKLKVDWRREFIPHGTPLPPLHPDDFVLPESWQLAMGVAGALTTYAAVLLFGTSLRAMAVAFYFLGVVLIATIDLKHRVLPEALVLPLLWAGLLYAAIEGALADKVLGAAAGYAMPCLLFHAVKLATGRGFMGHGDCRMFAASGAWVGLAGLPLVFGAFVAAALVFSVAAAARKRQGIVPSGLAHFVAAVIAVVGPELS
jgi:leader peptidase (prepilin peptidase) / N-methyltransferase